MMKQYFQNLAAEVGADEILLVGDKAILPSFNRRASLSISFATNYSKESKTSKSISKFENLEDDFAPSFPLRKSSSGSLSSKSSSSDTSSSAVKEPLFNSRWVSTPPLARSQSVSPVSKTRRSYRSRKISDELSVEIKSVILGEDNEDKIIGNNVRQLSPVVPKRKQSIEDCSIYLTVAAMSVRRTKSAELEAQVPHQRQSRWSPTE